MVYLGTLHVESVGEEEKAILIILVLLVIGISYLIIRPLVKWFVTLQSVKLLSYIICSLFVLLLYFITVFLVGDMQYLAVPFIKLLLQGIAFFGIALLVIYTILYFKNKQKHKSV